MTLSAGLTRNRTELDDLAEQINAEHVAACGAFKRGFEHAIKAGALGGM